MTRITAKLHVRKRWFFRPALSLIVLLIGLRIIHPSRGSRWLSHAFVMEAR